MLTFAKAQELLPPGDTVYTLTATGGVAGATVLEVCDGWLETSIGILDFEEHGSTWWLTERVAKENTHDAQRQGTGHCSPGGIQGRQHRADRGHH